MRGPFNLIPHARPSRTHSLAAAVGELQRISAADAPALAAVLDDAAAAATLARFYKADPASPLDRIFRPDGEAMGALEIAAVRAIVTGGRFPRLSFTQRSSAGAFARERRRPPLQQCAALRVARCSRSAASARGGPRRNCGGALRAAVH